MSRLIVKALAIIVGVFSLIGISFKWGQTSSDKKTAEKKANEAIENTEEYEENHASPYVDNPADFLCYEEGDEELSEISEDAENLSEKT